MNPEEGSVERILYCNRYYVVQWRWWGVNIMVSSGYFVVQWKLWSGADITVCCGEDITGIVRMGYYGVDWLLTGFKWVLCCALDIMLYIGCYIVQWILKCVVDIWCVVDTRCVVDIKMCGG
jgi:hypothetical protein